VRRSLASASGGLAGGAGFGPIDSETTATVEAAAKMLKGFGHAVESVLKSHQLAGM